MDKLIIEPSKYTPSVVFDPNAHILEIKGESYPENTSKFYEPVLDWLESYIGELGKNDPVTVNFGLIYFNSSSSKVIMDFFDMLEEAVENGTKVVVNWYYDETNETIQEYGEEFKEDIESLTFNLIEIKN